MKKLAFIVIFLFLVINLYGMLDLELYRTFVIGEDGVYGAKTIASPGDMTSDGKDDIVIYTVYYLEDKTTLKYIQMDDRYDSNIREVDIEKGGSVFSNIGDINADGVNDFGLGAPVHDYTIGRASIYLGNPVITDFSPEYVYNGSDFNAYFGQEIVTLGDMNDDGYSDFAICQPGGLYLGPGGEIRLYSGLTPSESYRNLTLEPNNGFFIFPPADVNGDHEKEFYFAKFNASTLELQLCVLRDMDTDIEIIEPFSWPNFYSIPYIIETLHGDRILLGTADDNLLLEIKANDTLPSGYEITEYTSLDFAVRSLEKIQDLTGDGVSEFATLKSYGSDQPLAGCIYILDPMEEYSIIDSFCIRGGIEISRFFKTADISGDSLYEFYIEYSSDTSIYTYLDIYSFVGDRSIYEPERKPAENYSISQYISNGALIFKSNFETDASISIYDITGKSVMNYSIRISKGQNVLPVDNLNSGIYFYRVFDNYSENQIKGKILITK